MGEGGDNNGNNRRSRNGSSQDEDRASTKKGDIDKLSHVLRRGLVGSIRVEAVYRLIYIY